MATSTQSNLQQSLQSKSVLIVDDDPETMLFVVRALNEHGISARIERSQQDAYRLLSQDAERRKIGLVIVDLQFIGQELPPALLKSRQNLGRNATANNTGQALGYWLWQEKKSQSANEWPRYVYASISPGFWRIAEESKKQEFKGGDDGVDEMKIRQSYVLDKLVSGGEEFYGALERAWEAWQALAETPVSGKTR